jgi:hypothetical protein
MKTAIRDASESLRGMIEQSLQEDPDLSPYFDPMDPAPDALGTMVVSLDTPQELSDHEDEGVSVWLYLLQRDECIYNAPPRRVAADRILPRPLPLRLHYLITPMVDDDTRQDATGLEHLILGRILQALHDDPELGGARLQASLAGSGIELRVRLEPLSLEEITRVWDALDRPYQLCVSVEMSVVPIASSREADRVAPVDSLLSEIGIAARVLEAGP